MLIWNNSLYFYNNNYQELFHISFGVEQIQYIGNGAWVRTISVQHTPFFVCINAYSYDTALNYLGILTPTTQTVSIQKYVNPDEPHINARANNFNDGISITACNIYINNVEHTLNDNNVAYNGFCFYFT